MIWVFGDDRMQVWDLVSPLVCGLGVREPRLYMAESGAPVDATAPALLLDGEPLVLREHADDDASSTTDFRLSIVEEILATEKDYCQTLKTVSDLYEKPLRKLLSMEKEDYKSFFDWVEPICSLSKMVIIKLTVAIDEWETYETKVATIFSKLLWTKYEEYQNLYLDTTLPLLKEKESSDEDFVALCQLRQGAAKYSLAALLELPRHVRHTCELHEQGMAPGAGPTAQTIPRLGRVMPGGSTALDAHQIPLQGGRLTHNPPPPHARSL
ncbi:hypothetical protein JTE90_020107 [Oedothorax gibbosus]|uniref:DH domain-containing protein n=1 Tax=Oedothorax gibbosus TaxID=931172 RepID=A0AAV6VPN3_9ARAC|nr:hypothetical protein JTE90_020107 [Oedothorax gibbosus]